MSFFVDVVVIVFGAAHSIPALLTFRIHRFRAQLHLGTRLQWVRQTVKVFLFSFRIFAIVIVAFILFLFLSYFVLI